MRPGALLVLAALTFAGCTAGEGSGATDVPTGSEAPRDVGDTCLRGQVVNEEALPVGRAQATLNGTPATAQTGDDGTFKVCTPEPGTYDVEVLADGYRPWYGSAELPGQDFRVTLIEIPPVTRRIEIQPFTIFYEVGFTTLDTTVGREVNSTTCSPCSFSVFVDHVPDILYLEADWTRTFMPPAGSGDIMYHILRAGAPFETGEDIGSGAKSKPFAFNYPRHELVKSEVARQDDGSWAFSGSIYCAGNAPCVEQRIDVYVSLLYEYKAVPSGYTALPES